MSWKAREESIFKKKESSSKDVDQKWYIEFSKMESLTSVTTVLDWKKAETKLKWIQSKEMEIVNDGKIFWEVYPIEEW